MFSLATLLTTLAAFCCCLTVVAEYTFEIQLVHYQNPNHLLIDNENCCEYRSDLSLCVCDNAFVFCVRERGSNSCDMEEIRTRKIATDDDDLSFSVGDRIGSEHRNPLTVTGDVWPGEVEILWEVYDLDASSRIDAASDLVARLLIPVPPLHPGNLTEVLEFIATNCSGCTLQLRFRLSCVSPSTGPNCSCVPANDTSGHFMCDPDTGERLCLEGYRNPESRCTECVPAINCSGVNGYCTQPGECLCREGFTGEHCTQCIGAAFSCFTPTSSVVQTPTPLMSPVANPTEPTVPSIEQPSLSKSALLTISVAGNVLVILIICAATTVVALVVCAKRRSRKRASFDVSFKTDLDRVRHGQQDLNHATDDHMYESLDLYSSGATHDVVSPLAPTYAAVNALYSASPHEPVLETNVAYDTLNVSRNAAYAAVEQEQSNTCRTMPLPNLP